MASASIKAKGSPSRRGRLIAFWLAGIVLAGCLAWLARVPLLQTAAQLWIVSAEPLAPADAVAVLGGGIEVRPFAAAEYYRAGLSRKILISDVRSSRSERLGVTTAHGDINRNVLLKLGVPDTAIESFGSANRNTREESLALRHWAEGAQARSIIVPTEIFSSRRVRWALERAFEGSGVHIQVAALDADEYGRNDWWQQELGLIAFQNEVLKYIYYRFKY